MIRRCSILISVVILFVACGSPKGPGTSVVGGAPEEVGAAAAAPAGLQFTLREVESPAASEQALPRPQLEPLGEADLRAVLARAPEWKKPSARQPSASPIKTERVPPRVRKAEPVQIQAGRPASAVAEGGPLKVVRYAPEGEVEMATTVSVTFSQPMVPLTTHGEATQKVPVRLEPQPPGRWRWIGTDTVLFEADGRFPMASTYQVVVPKGTRAQSGATLDKEVRFGFATPALRLEDHLTETTMDLRPLFFLRFNQQVDPSDVLENVSLYSKKGEVDLKWIDLEDLPSGSSLAQSVERARAATWLLAQPDETLRAASEYTVAVHSGARSAEGPRVTIEKQSFSFQTFEKLQVERVECGYEKKCRPGRRWEISFNNELDESLFDPMSISVEPSLSEVEIAAFDRRIVIAGAFKPHTNYRVMLPEGLRDVYGQSLGSAQPLTFSVGPAPPRFEGVGAATVVLSPQVAKSLSVHGQNLENVRIRLFASDVSRWSEFHQWHSNRSRGRSNTDAIAPPPGELIQDQVLSSPTKSDEMQAISVDLSAPIRDGIRQVIVWITAESAHDDEELLTHEEIVWIQLSDLRIHAYADDKGLLAWVTRISDGRPVPGAKVSFLRGEARAPLSTGSDGRVQLRLPKKKQKRSNILVAQLDNEQAFTAARRSIVPGREPSWTTPVAARDAIWYVNSDRGIYRPGETIHLHGWLRFVENVRGSDLRVPGQDQRKIAWSWRLPNEATKKEGTLKLTKNGGFDLALEVPLDGQLGYSSVDFSLVADDSVRHSRGFQIEEYRQPEYEVRVETTPGPHFLGAEATLTTQGRYYTGGPLVGARTRWTIRARPAHYAPPGHGDFHFGRIPHFWGLARGSSVRFSARTHQERLGYLDTRGRHSLRVKLQSMPVIEPTQLRATAVVEDVNRQAWSGQTSLLVHPSEYYMGLRAPARFVEAGAEIPIDWIVSRVEGDLVAGVDGEIELLKIESRQIDGEWTEERTSVGRCDGQSESQPETCRFQPSAAGSYLAVGVVRDAQGRRNESALSFYVADTGGAIGALNLQDDKAVLIADRDEYAVGDTARVLIASSVYPATGLLTMSRNGLVESRVVTVDGPTRMVELDLSASHHPLLFVRLDLVGPDGKRLDESSDLVLPVNNPSLALQVEARPRAVSVEPGARTSLETVVLDASGAPVKEAEVVLIVVDEANLALTGKGVRGPELEFFRSRTVGTWSHLFFEEYRRREVPRLYSSTADVPRLLRSAAAGPEGSGARELLMREDFRTLAAFRANVKTDAKGRVKVDFKMPDTLTRYRVVALAAAGADRFGSAESSITASLPLMVRPSPPRFSHLDDRFELPVVLHNESEQPLEVTVAGRARGIELGTAGGDRLGFKTRVPAGQRVEVPFPATATRAGEASFQFVATAADLSDGFAGSFPVQLPTRVETFATFGVIDKGAVRHKVAPPEGVRPEVGGLEVVLSSSQLESLTDALLALIEYPYGCTEQVASRLMAAISMSDVARHIQSERMIDKQAFKEMIGASIERLGELQRSDGGFGFWPGAKRSDAYLSVHATHALARARNAEFPVSEGAFKRALQYVSRIASGELKHGEGAVGLSVRAYAMYALQIAGHPEIKLAAPLLAGRPIEEFPLEALGWMLPTFAEAGQSAEVRRIVKYLGNQLVETAQTAQFKTGYTEGAHVILHSSRRTDAVITDALVDADPYNTAIPKLVEGLLAARRGGSWATTQENAFALVAIKNYFDSFVSRHPHFDARVWRGEELILQEQYRRRTPRQVRASIPMAELVASGAPTDLVIEKDGAQRLYYRMALRYTEKNPPAEPVSHGFTVSRSYHSVDDPDDVVRLDDGRWRIRAGARVRVTVDLVAPIRRHHVALVDRLPAGLEAINPHLAVSAGAAPERRLGRWLPWVWYDHQNLRDDRAEAFATSLVGGVYSYSYTARATAPGTFVAPAATAEEMYNPETFGATAAEVVVVAR